MLTSHFRLEISRLHLSIHIMCVSPPLSTSCFYHVSLPRINVHVGLPGENTGKACLIHHSCFPVKANHPGGRVHRLQGKKVWKGGVTDDVKQYVEQHVGQR